MTSNVTKNKDNKGGTKGQQMEHILVSIKTERSKTHKRKTSREEENNNNNI